MFGIKKLLGWMGILKPIAAKLADQDGDGDFDEADIGALILKVVKWMREKGYDEAADLAADSARKLADPPDNPPKPATAAAAR